MSAPDRDGQDVIALARRVGLAAVQPADASRAAPDTDINNQVDGGDTANGGDVIALARRVGLPGVRSGPVTVPRSVPAQIKVPTRSPKSTTLVARPLASVPKVKARKAYAAPAKTLEEFYSRLSGTAG